MSNITVSLPDGSTRELAAGSTALDMASSIGPRLAKAAVAAKVDGEQVDLTRPLPDGATVAIITDDTPEGRHVLRHSTAHVMAQAVTRLFPGAKFSIGPAIENGFYYDFELPGGKTFSDDDLAAIEAEMREIVKADQPFVRSEHSIEDAKRLFADQPYKVEIIERVENAAAGDSAFVATDAGEVGMVDGVATISAYRNALLRNAPRPELAHLAASLDPDVVAWLELMREGQRVMAPDPGFVARLATHLEAAPGPAADPQPAPPQAPTAPVATD